MEKYREQLLWDSSSGRLDDEVIAKMHFGQCVPHIQGAIIDAAGQAASGMQAIDEDNSDESDAPKEDELHPIHPQQAALATTHKLMQGQVNTISFTRRC